MILDIFSSLNTGESPAEGYEDDEGVGASLLREMHFGEATEGEGFWSRGSRRGTLSPVAKPQRRGGKKRREREETPAPPLSGKAGSANEQQL